MKRSKQRQREPAYISYYETVQSQQLNQSVEVEYEIQQILQHRIIQKKQAREQPIQTSDKETPLEQLKEEDLQYLIKWVGYQELSWQPASNLRHAPEIVQRYRRQNKSLSKKTRSQARLSSKHSQHYQNRLNKQIKAAKYFNFQKVYGSEKLVKKDCEDLEEVVQISELKFAEQKLQIKSEQQSMKSKQKLYIKDRKTKSSALKRKNLETNKKKATQQLNSQKLKQIQQQMGNFKERKFYLGYHYYSNIDNDPHSNKLEDSRAQDKRALSLDDAQQKAIPKTTKKVKPNEQIEPPNAIAQEQEDSSIIKPVNIDELLLPQNQPDVASSESQPNVFSNSETKSLAQRIKDQIQSLEEDSLALHQIRLRPWKPVKLLAQTFAEESLQCQKPKKELYTKTEYLFQRKTSQICSDCLVWQQKRKQLNSLYHQQLCREINFDCLFLYQKILQIMTKHSEISELRQCKVQKLIDISENRLLCKLILKKMVRYSDLNGLISKYTVCKFVKIHSVWFAILKIKDCRSGSALDHFKYVLAETMLPMCLNSIAEFLRL